MDNGATEFLFRHWMRTIFVLLFFPTQICPGALRSGDKQSWKNKKCLRKRRSWQLTRRWFCQRRRDCFCFVTTDDVQLTRIREAHFTCNRIIAIKATAPRHNNSATAGTIPYLTFQHYKRKYILQVIEHKRSYFCEFLLALVQQKWMHYFLGR